MAGSSAVLSVPSAHDTKVTQKYRFPVSQSLGEEMSQMDVCDAVKILPVN